MKYYNTYRFFFGVTMFAALVASMPKADDNNLTTLFTSGLSDSKSKLSTQCLI